MKKIILTSLFVSSTLFTFSQQKTEDLAGEFICVQTVEHKTSSVLLIINDIIVRDSVVKNCLLKQFDFADIKKMKYYTQSKAKEKFKNLDVPKDGVLFVYLKKKYLLDLDLCK